MSDQDRESVFRLRCAAAISDYQLERAARETAGRRGSHIHLAEFPEMRDILPWVTRAA